MSEQETTTLLEMCGEAPTAAPALLPSWIRSCAAKNTSDQFKYTIIRKQLMEQVRYEDAEVPITFNLLRIISKRNWLGKDGDCRNPSIVNAMDGLSPFLMKDFDNDEVAKLNSEAAALQEASHTTVEDVNKIRQKMKASVPAASDEFMLVLKRYANLLFAIFSSRSPLFKCITMIIDALRKYSRASRSAMSMQTKASILWVILLQSRTFAIGNMEILASFTTMHADLCAKKGTISHAEVPAALLPDTKATSTNKRKDNPDNADAPPSKRQRENNKNCWNNLLRSKLEQPLKIANYPTFTAIMKYCDNADPSSAVPRDGRVCTPKSSTSSTHFG